MRCLCNVVAKVIAQQEVGDIHTIQNISSKACTKFAFVNESKMIKSIFTTNQFKALYMFILKAVQTSDLLVGWTSDSLMVPTLRLIYRWDGTGLMLWSFVRPTGVYLLDFFCSGIQFYLLLSPYLCFISLLYLDLYVLGDDALIS